ncbi:MAG: hypothetical protein U5K55_02485 [Aliarcobacter sp.]|nr:hypothetical protein [Aliarcobacter sp.]
MKKYFHQNCDLESIENENTSILHCEKNDWFIINEKNKKIWDEKKVNEFWEQLRIYCTIKKNNNLNPYYFKDFIFPNTNIILIEEDMRPLLDDDNKLLEDYYFWCKGESIVFDQTTVCFSNVTFYEFELAYVKFKDDLTLDNITVLSGFEINDVKLKHLTVNNCQNIKLLNLKNLSFDSCFINKSKIEILYFYKTKFENLTIYSSKFTKVYFDTIIISNGHLANSTIVEVCNSSGVHIINKDTFSYQNMTIKKGVREYFRLLKNYFFDKKDYIEANEMYQKEMNAYLKETYTNLIGTCDDWFKNLGNLIIAGFGRISSNFGQSWLLPLFWISMTLFSNIYFTSSCELLELLADIPSLLDEMARLFYLKDRVNFSFLDLLFKIPLGLFVYQLTEAIKRKTKY